MLLDLPPSLSPTIPSSSFTNSDGNSSRQHLAFVDDEDDEEEGDEGQNILFEMEKIKEEEKGNAGFLSKSKRNSRKLLSTILSFHQPAIILLTPLILCPLLLSNKPEYRCAFCVILMAIYWMGQVMPLAVTALLPAVLFPLTGILPARDVSKEFLNDTNFLFLGGLIVATAVEKCHLHERIALRVLLLVGSEPRKIMLGFMGLTALLSMFISNTATTAMMLPIGKSVVNLLEKKDKNYGILGVHMNNLIYQKDNNSERPSGMAKGLIICIAFAANIGGVGTLTGTPPNLVLIGMLSTLFPSVDTKVNYVSWLALTLPLMIGCLLLCWLILCWFFLWNVPEVDQQVGQMIRKMNRELAPMSYAEKSVSFCFLLLLLLWIGRDPGFIPGIGAFFQQNFYSDSTSALLIGILLFLLPDENPFLPNKNNKKGKEQKRLMDWPTMQQHFPWNVVILLGGGFALAAGVKKSGLSHLIGQSLGRMEQQPVWILQLICIFVTMFVTNICSNTVTASIFIPIVASMAQRTGNHPLVLMLPTTLACSFAFILPVGSPPNAIVFSSGLLTVSDMIYSGLTISVVSTIAMIGYLGSISPLILPIDHFPEWATININETTNGL